MTDLVRIFVRPSMCMVGGCPEVSMPEEGWQSLSMCFPVGCPEVSTPELRHASTSTGFIGCGAIVHDEDSILIRSSLRPEVIVEFTADEWHALVTAIKNGEFDTPLNASSQSESA
jgi:hypothetical protein